MKATQLAAYWASTPLELTCRLPARRPVPNYYSCLQTFHLLGWAAESAAYEMSKQRLQQHTGVDMNLFMAKRVHPCKGPCISSPPPQRADIYEDIPSKS